MNTEPKIAGIGEVLWDIYPTGQYLGGAPANFASHVALAGAKAFLLSRIGNDPLGVELRRHLQEQHVDTIALQVDPAKPTGTVRVHVDQNGQPSFDCSHDTAFDNLNFESTWQNIAGTLDALLFGTLAQRSDQSSRAIQTCIHAARHAVKLFDVNLRSWNTRTLEIVEQGLQICDILKLNKTELESLKQAKSWQKDDLSFLKRLITLYNIKLIAITLGSRGCLLVDHRQHITHPGFKVPVTDTTGCGDAFAAALIVKYLQKSSLEVIAEFANKLGAFVAMHQGAVPAWAQDDLDKLI